MGTHDKKLFAEVTSHEGYDYFKEVENKFKQAELNGKGVVDSAKNIEQILKKLEKMVQNTDKTTDDERIENLKKERDFIDDKLNPVLRKFDGLLNKLKENVEEVRFLLTHEADDELMEVTKIPRYDEIDGH